MRFIQCMLVPFLLLIAACTSQVNDLSNETSHDEEPKQDIEENDYNAQIASEEGIAFKELERKIGEFEDKGFEVQPLWRLHDTIAQKNAAISAHESNNEPDIQKSTYAEDEPIETCTSNPNPTFTNEFTDTSKIKKISPSGFWITSDVFKGHSFIWTEGKNIPIYAPIDMSLTSGAFYTENNKNQYALYFEVSCEVSVKFDHIHEPIQAIKDAFPATPKDDTRGVYVDKVNFKAGDLIAYTRGNTPSGNWDFGVYNSAALNNIPNLEQGNLEANCPFDYFEDNTYKGLYTEDSLLCKK